ncbi:MAG: hypothetical protein M3Q69_11780 [Acidobacteriota bacterium]|nr:hypothetical protein [Acidobacteriota bacterium]
MRRGVFDVLRRAVDNTLANWPLIVIRLSESLVFALLAILTAVAIFAPLLLSLGIDLAQLKVAEDFEGALSLLAEKWMFLAWALLAIGVLLTVFFAIHSFIEAASVRVYVDAERAAGPALVAPRTRFRTFTGERWFEGGKEGWWVVFMIYTLASTFGLLLLLIPLLPTLVLLLIFRDTAPGASVAIGCLGIGLTILLAITVMLIGSIWCNRAIAAWGAHGTNARASLAASWAAMRGDFARHFLIAVAVFVVAMAGSTFFGGFSFVAGMMSAAIKTPALQIATLPIRIFTSILSSAFSAAVTSWFLASYSALAVE